MPITEALSTATRGMLIARANCRFLIGDYNQIEARLIAWQAGQQNVLDTYASGLDIYCVQATGIYNRTITKANKDERQVGKYAILAFGYQGGIAAMVRFCRIYKADIKALYKVLWPTTTPDERDKADAAVFLYYKQCERLGSKPCTREEALACDVMKQRFRAANPFIVQYWLDLEVLAAQAIETRNPVYCHKVVFFMSGPFLHVRLPSGRDMKYPFAQVDDRGKISYRCIDERGQWSRESTYGGKFAENITQAIARDFICEATLNLDDAGYLDPDCVFFNSHDELVVEVKNTSHCTLEGFLAIMKKNPTWAPDLPIGVEGWQNERYGKAA